MLEEYTADELAESLVASGDFRILRRLDLPAGPLCENQDGTAIGLVIDVETSGLDPSHDQVIELAMRRFRFDRDGKITKLDQSYVWREDPGVPLDPVITRLTGLTDTDLAGCRIEDSVAVALLQSADVCIAHNAKFDRRFIERRFPEAAGKPWACSLTEVDWASRGFDGSCKILSWLLAQCGWFHEAHQAAADVDAVIAILSHVDEDGRSVLAELIETASQPGWLIRAIGANYLVKDLLKARGYHWDGDISAWYREVSNAERESELAWLQKNVYAPQLRPRLEEPSLREITWLVRHG